MKDSTSLLSLIVVYRNRDIARVTRFLESLTEQTNQSFELIFVDYGSSEAYKTQVASLVKSFSFVKYLYTDTRGIFWNRSKALNLGIKQAQGQYITTVDIDLIFPPNFVEQTLQIIHPQFFIQYQCYYLPKDFKNYEQLFLQSFDPQKHFTQTVETTAYGIITFPVAVLTKTGGYDEYFQLWGFEDIEFVDRLKKLANQQKKKCSNIRIYHQWHPHTKESFPKGWEEVMIDYKRQKKQEFVKQGDPKVLSESCRPSLQILSQGNTPPTYSFTYPKEQAFSRFCYQFSLLQSNETLIINQTFELIKNNHSTWLGQVLNRLNQLFSKVGISYRWVDLETYNSEVVTKEEVRSFLFYFLINYQTEILDYYFDTDTIENKIYLIVVKK